MPVHVVDSRAVAMALGFAVLEAARFSVGPEPPHDAPSPASGPFATVRARWRGRGRAEPLLPSGAQVADRGLEVAGSTRVWFLVDSLDHLRRGGRLSIPAAAIGIVLGLRPILTLDHGRIEIIEKVRTRRAARDRLVALAVADVAQRPSRASPCTTSDSRRWRRPWSTSCGPRAVTASRRPRCASPARCSRRTPGPACSRSSSPTPDRRTSG